MINPNAKLVKKSAQEMQDEIFKRMDANKKIRLISRISSLIISINSIVKDKIERKYLAQWAIDELIKFADGRLTQIEEKDLALLKKYVK